MATDFQGATAQGSRAAWRILERSVSGMLAHLASNLFEENSARAVYPVAQTVPLLGLTIPPGAARTAPTTIGDTVPDLNHKDMCPPFLRVVDKYPTPLGDRVVEWDLRLSQPNNGEPVSPAVLHSLEHCLTVYLREADPHIFLARPFGCGTGLSIAAINLDDFDAMSDRLAGALQSILTATEVPLANEIQCGYAALHTLAGAQRHAKDLLERRDEWAHPLAAAAAPVATEA
jgi:S-ribosylhomocysteine lyase